MSISCDQLDSRSSRQIDKFLKDLFNVWSLLSVYLIEKRNLGKPEEEYFTGKPKKNYRKLQTTPTMTEAEQEMRKPSSDCICSACTLPRDNPNTA